MSKREIEKMKKGSVDVKYKDKILRSNLIYKKHFGKEPLSAEEIKTLEKLQKESKDELAKEMKIQIEYLHMIQRENNRDA